MTSTVAPLDTQSVLAAIRGIGHWRVRLVPESAEQRFNLPSDCRDAVAASSVLLRGWDYPHIPIRNDDSHCQAPVHDGWEGMVDWDRHRELWRLMRSGQFIHYLALWEDIAPEFRGQRVLGLSGVVYTLVEIVEFSRRLTGTADYGSAAELEVGLFDVRDRGLKNLDPRRMLDRTFTTAETSVELRRDLQLPLTEAGGRSISRDLAAELFDMFQLKLSPSIIGDIQNELIERR